MARPIWSGTISFGLVNVPVKAYSAVHDHAVHFHQLEKDTRAHGSTTRRCRRRPASRSPKEEIEQGFEVSQGPLRGRRRRGARRPAARTRRGRSTSATSSSWRPSTRSTTTTRTGSAPDDEPARRPTSCCRPRWRARSVSASAPSSCATSSTWPPSARSTARWPCRRCASPTRSCPGGEGRRRPERPFEAGAQGAAPGQPDHRRPDLRLGSRAVPRHLHRAAARPHRRQGQGQGGDGGGRARRSRARR